MVMPEGCSSEGESGSCNRHDQVRGGPRNVTISHVRAHARTPGNEAADELAKVVTRDMGVSRDARRALKLAQQVHRRVYGESHTSATSANGGAPGRGFGDG